MKRKVIRSLIFVLDGIGLNITTEKLDSKIWRYVCCMLLFIYTNFTLIMYSFTHRENFFEAASPIIFIGGSNIMMVGVSAIFYHRQKLRQMLFNMDCGMFTYPDEDRIPVNYSWILNEKNNANVYYLVLLVILFAYSVLLTMAVLQWCLYKQIKIFIYPNWTPWKGGGATHQISSLILQHVTVICGLWFFYIVCIFLIATAIEFAKQVERLCAAVQSLDQRTKVMTLKECNRTEVLFQIQDDTLRKNVQNLQESKFNNKFNAFFKENIINCTRHHQIIITNYKLFHAVFRTIFSVELTYCSVTLSLGLFYMIYAPNLQLVMNSFVVILVVIMNFFTRCFIGEQFAKLNIKLRNTVFYESRWYEQSKENWQLLFLFHNQVSYPINLKGFSVIQASLTTFTSIIRTAYSFFSVLKR
ncbi:uncharacterized protein LOC135840408 isoform X2 [Planococcus citri]